MNENKKLIMFDFDGVLNRLPMDTYVKSLCGNYKLFIISSSYGSYIKDFLKSSGLDDCFSEILGLDVHSSKEVKIKNILEKYGTAPSNAVLITDSLGDIREANTCSVPSIGVTWGISTKEILEKGNPVEIIDDPRNLVEAIENVLK